ncbi:mevalonate kinase [Halorubellus sp. JP-L1]|uniref:mevalonate kinase n=1 Tax=Halorubellus sp. JP-L1 TaxID=2715753 RepID=UPI00140E0937|nr:mevalonate kinase [Halorubellus sp. JP-L1]NHN40782.1 mevalonate kinase [Halorubellus sp. JP-L1]
MVTASAPGKVYCFGEHAVVYGEPAVPCAIERRATVTVERRDDDRLRVESEDLRISGFTVEYDGAGGKAPDVDAPTRLLEAATGYVDAAIEQARDAADAPDVGFDVHVESAIPLGAGLGSSAAVVVATIAAASRALDCELDEREIAERAYRSEHAVQDGEASRADTFCSTMGGAVRVAGDDCRRLGTPDLPFVVGYDGGAGDTGELVAGVRALRDEYDFAADTVAAIGDVVRRGETLIEDANAVASEETVSELGRLMNFNHGLLEALGVSSRSLDEMVWAAREAGAAGAKLTGAGGGGCVVALDASDATETALELTPACEDVFRAELASEGVRYE